MFVKLYLFFLPARSAGFVIRLSRVLGFVIRQYGHFLSFVFLYISDQHHNTESGCYIVVGLQNLILGSAGLQIRQNKGGRTG